MTNKEILEALKNKARFKVKENFKGSWDCQPFIVSELIIGKCIVEFTILTENLVASPFLSNDSEKTQDNYYVYYYKDGRYTYERTCGTEQSAKDRVKTLIERGYSHATYTINNIIKDAYY